MSDFLAGVPKELHEKAIRKRLRNLEWIIAICGLLIWMLFPYPGRHGFWIYLATVVVLIIIFIIITFLHYRTKALLKS